MARSRPWKGEAPVRGLAGLQLPQEAVSKSCSEKAVDSGWREDDGVGSKKEGLCELLRRRLFEGGSEVEGSEEEGSGVTERGETAVEGGETRAGVGHDEAGEG